MKKYLTECIGTFFLVLVIGLVVGSGTEFAPIPIGVTLMVMVYMGGHISGAHYNPAVTLGVLMSGNIALGEAVQYWIFQIVGAVLAALVSWWLMGDTFALAPGIGYSALQALGVEVLFTFALVLVVLNTAVATDVEGNSYYGLAIGFTVLAAAFAGGGISGGAFNSAVGVGPILVELVSGNGSSFSNIWLYLAGPLAGGALAAMVYKYQTT
jgi:aquaporin Z